MRDDRNGAPLVSVIIPVYQAGKYLDACISSVLTQNYPAIELILVDDGSSDGSAGICDKYVKEYQNIRSVHQKNRGPGNAKNVGMKLAKGEYLLFLDADDCLDGKEAVTRLAGKADAEQADIVTGNYRRFQGKKTGGVIRHHLKGGNAGETDFRLKGFLTEGHLLMNWAKIYRASFLRRCHIVFPDCKVMEDKLFNMMCCVCQPIYGFMEESVYLYRAAEGSVTDRYKENVEELEDAWLFVGEEFDKFLQKHQERMPYEDLLAFHMFCGIFTLGRQSLQSGKRAGRKTVKLLKNYGKNPLVRREISKLAKGNYIKEVQSPLWRILIRTASGIFCLGGYRLITAGIMVLQGLGTEKRGYKTL